MGSAVVIVTGGNNGIGLHVTEALLAEGHRVAVADLGGGNLASLTTSYPSELLFLPCDVATSPPSTSQLPWLVHET